MKIHAWVFCILALVALSPAAQAATIVFENGDRLTGEPAGFEDGRLLLRTAHLGVVSVDLRTVASVEGDLGFEIVEPAADPAPASGALVSRPGVEAEVAVLSEDLPGTPWTGQVEFGAHFSSGNTDRRGFHLKAGAVHDTADGRFEATAHALYAEEDGERTVNEQFAGLRYDVKWLPWYAFAVLSGEKDEFENLDLRLIFAPGLGYVIADGEEFKAKVEVGPAVSWVDYEDDDGEIELEARIGFYAEAAVFDKAKVTQVLELFPSLSESGEFRLHSETAFEQPLSEVLYFKLSMIDDYNSDVPRGVDKNDLKVLASLVFKF